jgi:endo-alpha-1,4-polygalactosaminidase (GH114 family)
MSVSYDVFSGAFLDKVTEYNFPFKDYERNGMIDRYMKRSIAAFNKICKYNLSTTGDDISREFDLDVLRDDIDELADIISEGMVVQWLKPYTYKQENLENILNTRDFTTYSPSELLLRVKDTHKQAKRDFTNMMREYSYNHGDLTDLHI